MYWRDVVTNSVFNDEKQGERLVSRAAYAVIPDRQDLDEIREFCRKYLGKASPFDRFRAFLILAFSFFSDREVEEYMSQFETPNQAYRKIIK